MFTETEVQIGTVRPGHKTTVNFPYDELVIQSVQSGCTCSDARDIRGEKKLMITHNAPQFPVHLMGQGKAVIDVPITVDYITTDNADLKQQIILRIKGTLVP